LKWCDELEKEVARVGCRNWRLNAQSREAWRKLIEEVKTIQGCSAIGRIRRRRVIISKQFSSRKH
jgi:hypothetical protein